MFRDMKAYAHLKPGQNGTKRLVERYEKGELTIRDFIYCVIEPPDPTYPYAKVKTITIGAGSATEEPIKTETRLPQELPEGAFAYWFFVNEWNSVIHIAAMNASLRLPND